MQENRIKYLRNARYFTSGKISNEVTIWFVLHGYGYLANSFLKIFNKLDTEKHFVVSPEGLHRYYMDSDHQKVGATWMTREDREHDIEEYLLMLNSIYDEVNLNHQLGFCKVNLLGFSQGTATASRWAISNPDKFDKLILNGGDFANEISEPDILELSKNLELIIANGKSDEIFNLELQEKLKKRLHSYSIPFKILEHDEGHRVPVKLLEDC